jgi:hypothetical protein
MDLFSYVLGVIAGICATVIFYYITIFARNRKIIQIQKEFEKKFSFATVAIIPGKGGYKCSIEVRDKEVGANAEEMVRWLKKRLKEEGLDKCTQWI